MTEIVPLAPEGLLLITPRRHGDERGFFSETYSRPALAEAGFDRPFVQDNHSRTEKRGVLRGLHFQRPPRAQDKLVRVSRGAVFDVAVDIRAGSPTFGQWAGEELSESNWRQLLVPAGFAHGFLTLTENCEVLYKVSDLYAPELEDGLAFDDPEIGIGWPIPPAEIITNARDRAWPRLHELKPL
ncbi:MAG TPA: dTDP-4-dehydrorhamnose 3,5-epimerase [Caulobacteraceae bacterium]|jgi:dTDP-4-dehydrorhamnose 3,5-epimerase